MQPTRVINRKHWIWALSLAALLHLVLFVRLGLAPDKIVLAEPSAQAITIALAPESAPEPVAKAKPAPKPEPIAKPKPKPQPPPPPRPKPKPKPAPQPAPLPSPEPSPEPAIENDLPAPAVQREARPARAAQPAAPPQPGGTGSLRDTPPDYRATLSAWLSRHKQYPRRARRLGQQGTAVLHFVIDRNGKVLEWDISSSSGHRLLDAAVETMIRRSDPLPAMPASMTVSKLELTVPVNFALR